MVYFISDTHFNHKNIIKYCNRPYKSVEEMNKVLIENWNRVVKDDDVIYHLGDFALYDEEELFKRLNGNIILIRGNHDRKSASYYEKIGFKVLKNAPIKLDEYKLILSHKPISDNKIPEGYINIHGHIHDKNINDGYPKEEYSLSKHFNVSVEVINYKPISIEEIASKL